MYETTHRSSLIRATVTVALMALLAGCGYYSTTGGLPAHIKTLGVGFFGNNTLDAGLAETLARHIADRVVSRSDMTYTAARAADAVYDGEIIAISETASTYSTTDEARRYRLTVRVSARLTDRRNSKTVWENQEIFAEEEYDPGGGSSARLESLGRVLGDIAAQIVDLSSSGW